MLSQKTKKLSWGPNSMAKGLMALQMVAGRDAQKPDWRLHQARRCVRLLEPVPGSTGKVAHTGNGRGLGAGTATCLSCSQGSGMNLASGRLGEGTGQAAAAEREAHT